MNRLDELKTFFHIKNSLEVVPYRIRHLVELLIPFANNNPYSGTEQSLMNFQYQKTYSARQDDSFNNLY